MKQYFKEMGILLLQLGMFYVFPLFAGPTDAMGMVFLILLSALLLSLAIGILSNKKIKYLYPIVIAMAFVPSVWIYYNASALIHAVWYFVISAVGLLAGSAINVLARKLHRGK